MPTSLSCGPRRVRARPAASPLRALSCFAALLAAAFALVACGGGGDDEGDITDVLTTSVKSTDPADCTKLETQQFVEQTEFSTGPEAVTECQQDASDTSDDPDSVDVTDIQVDGDNATANVAFTGGSFGGSTLTVALVKDGDQWKLDRITDIVTLDVATFKQSFADRLAASGDVPAQVKSCIGQAIQGASEDQIKQALLSGTEQDLVALFSQCIPSG
jgi:hypothetical protein